MVWPHYSQDDTGLNFQGQTETRTTQKFMDAGNQKSYLSERNLRDKDGATGQHGEGKPEGVK